MAIWQFSFVMIPQEKIISSENTFCETKSIANLEEYMSWEGYCINTFSLKKLSKILKCSKSWTDDIVQFGMLDGTCVEMYYENKILKELSIRIDLRSANLELLEAILNFIKTNSGIILTSSGILIKPIMKNFVEEIKKSEAYSFVKSPEIFLNNLSK